MTGPTPRAQTADLYDLYEASVQAPRWEAGFFDRIFREAFDRKPLHLREDFCGTSAVSVAWAESDPDRTAVGVDIDPVPLRWARARKLRSIPSEVRARVRLVEGDVRETSSDPVDVVSALNFSWLSLHHRDELIDWLASVHESLNDPGLLVLDLMGGPKCMQAGSDTPRRIDDFEYVWEHVDFDPVSHRTLCRMHFRFDDGSAIDGAFEYDWRLWTLPELLDALEDVGFSKWAIYWEGLDPETGEGNGTFHKVGHAPPDNAWVAYVVAER